MLAKLDSFQDEIRTNREEMLAEMETKQGKMKSHHQAMMAKSDVHHERMRASVTAWRQTTTVCQKRRMCIQKKKLRGF